MNARETITLTPGCKVNLYLRLTGLTDGGYHTLESLFLPLAEPHDELALTFGPASDGFSLSAGDPALEGGSNTVARAWRAFGERTGFAPGLAVRLDKGVPTGAGLGGGSADAAAVLMALNERAGDRALAPAELSALAAGIGADVPFFLLGAPAWAEGIGERLTPLDLDLGGMTLLLLCPPEHVSTAWAYKAFDARFPGGLDPAGNRRDFLTCAKEKFKDSSRSCVPLYNSFERIVFPAYPNLRRYKEELLRSGACAAVMSGSGASLLGLFRDTGRAEDCARKMRARGVAAHPARF